MDATLFDALRYRSEGTDLDFKQMQYRFVRGTEAEKAELLKDVLAMANAWREGMAYILIGFRDARPHPAEVMGINEHLDDASLQQFVNSKIKPKISFSYEEHTYEGKTVAVLRIPRQTRPFYLQHPYGHLKSNVVYVRRGSSTDEAEPPEIAKMVLADSGRGEPLVDFLATEAGGPPLAQRYERAFISLEKLPDYEPHKESYPFGINSVSVYQANHHFWRELGRFVAVRMSTLEIKVGLKNRSSFALSGTKIEVIAKPLGSQRIRLILGKDLPNIPERQSSLIRIPHGGLTNVIGAREPHMTLEENAQDSICHIRLGTLLPGEIARGSDTLGLRISGPGPIAINFRILAAELSTPIDEVHEVFIDGLARRLDLEGLVAFVREPLPQALLGSIVG